MGQELAVGHCKLARDELVGLHDANREFCRSTPDVDLSLVRYFLRY